MASQEVPAAVTTGRKRVYVTTKWYGLDATRALFKKFTDAGCEIYDWTAPEHNDEPKWPHQIMAVEKFISSADAFVLYVGDDYAYKFGASIIQLGGALFLGKPVIVIDPNVPYTEAQIRETMHGLPADVPILDIHTRYPHMLRNLYDMDPRIVVVSTFAAAFEALALSS